MSKTNRAPFLKEVATRHAIYPSSVSLLPNPDPVLRKGNRNLAAYRDLLSDPHVGGCVRRRKASVKAKLHHLLPNQSPAKVVDFVEKALSKIDIDKLVSEGLDAALFGYQPAEICWVPEGGYLWPASVLAKPAEWFCFDDNNQLRFRTKEQPHEGILLPEGKFILFSQDASYDNPYGIGDLSRCFWPVQFKRGGFKFWITFCERYGMPWLVGRHPRGTSVAETDQMLERLENMVQDAIAVIPDDASIDIVEATGKANTSDVYEKLLYYCRSEIAIALLGQNQTTESSANLASAKAGMEVAKDISDADARMVANGINQLIDWMVYYNFGEVERPTFELIEPNQIEMERAARDKILHDAGVKLSADYYKRYYGFDDADFADAGVEDAGVEDAGVAGSTPTA